MNRPDLALPSFPLRGSMEATVPARFVVAMLTMAEREQLKPETLLEGLSLDRAQLKKLGARVAHDDYAALSDRIKQRIGSGALLADAATRNYGEMWPELTAITRAFIRPRLLYRIVLVLTGHAFPYMQTEYRELPDGRVLWRISIPRALQGSLALMEGTYGAVRGMSLLLGLGPATVDAALSEYSASFLITLPESGTLAGRLRTRLERLEAVRRLVGIRDDLVHLRSTIVDAHKDLGTQFSDVKQLGSELLDEVGRAIAELGNEDDVISASLKLIHEQLEHPWVALERSDGRRREEVGVSEPESSRVAYRIPGRAGGAWQLAVEVNGSADVTPLERFIPWMGLALASANAGGAAGPQPEAGLGVAWNLTPRQTEVLAHLARGLSNSEIGVSLGCSVRTVEIHVTQILRKAGEPSRSRLLARMSRAS